MTRCASETSSIDGQRNTNSHALNRRPVVLVLTRCYLPGYRAGGPIRTIANLVERLGDEFDFHIVCLDRDHLDTAPYPDVAIDDWNRVGKARVFYAGGQGRSWRRLRRLLRDTPHDLLYLNSFFHSHFTIKPLVLRALHAIPRRPLVVAPRGEFAEAALGLKGLRKYLYMLSARCAGLYSGARWQASTDNEAADIRRQFGVPAARIHEACNLATLPTSTPPQVSPRRTAGQPLRVCFLSRITPMKNLDFALEVLALIRQPVQFSIHGPIFSDTYWARCRARIETLPAHVSTSYFGAVKPDAIRATIAQNDLFFVPSRGENFGHVFLEAWSAGVPVLVSDRTPWRALETKGIGWDLPLADPAAFAAVVDRVAVMHMDAARILSQRCASFARKQIEAPATLEANRRLFLDLLPGNAPTLDTRPGDQPPGPQVDANEGNSSSRSDPPFSVDPSQDPAHNSTR